MPASSRLTDLFGSGSSLRRQLPLLPAGVESDGWQQIWANGMWGGHLTATTDAALTRVRVDLYWPGIRHANVYRVHPDGEEVLVRGGDPALVLDAWARWDYEAPLDSAVYYKAVSDEREDLEVTTAPVTLSSATEAWLKHPTRPSLNRVVTIRALDNRGRVARKAALRPPLRKHPLFVHGKTSGHIGQVVFQTDGVSELDALNEFLDDGGELLLQLPSAWGGHHWYISVDRSSEQRLEPMLGSLLVEHVGIQFEVTDRPDGEAEAGPDDSYEDLADLYPTYNHQAASGLSYIELSMQD